MSFQNCKIISVDTNPAEYHATNDGVAVGRGHPKFRVSSSSLREFGRCPARWMAGYESPDSEAKDYGSLLDTLVLTPAQFDRRFAVAPTTYVNKKGEVKDWRNDKRIEEVRIFHEQHEGKTIIKRTAVKAKDDEEAEAKDEAPLTLEGATTAKNKLLSDQYCRDYIEASDKQVLVRGEWKDDATGIVVPLQCLIDLVPRKGTKFELSAGDLKSTRSAHPSVWPRYSKQRGYHVQGAFDIDMLNAAERGGKLPPPITMDDFDPNAGRITWLFVLSENFYPYQPAKSVLSQRKLHIGRLVYQALLAKYAKCIKTGKWGGYEDSPFVTPDGCNIDDMNEREAEYELAALEGRPDDLPPEDNTSETPT